MVDWLCVPLTHLLVARNWNLAMSGLPLTASRVAKRVAVSTPLRTGFSVTVMVVVLLARVGSWRRPAHGRATPWDGAARAVPGPAERSRPQVPASVVTVRTRQSECLETTWRRCGDCGGPRQAW